MRLKSFRNLLVTLLCVCCFGNAIAEATLTGHTAEIRFLGFLPDGKTLLSGADDSSIRRWDTDTGMAVGFWQQVPKFDSAPSTVILSQSANGRLLARGGKGQGSVDIWDIDRVAMLRTFQAHQRPTVGVALSGDGTLLASFSQSDMRVWDAISGKTRFFVNAPNLYAFLALAVSADGRKVAASSSDKKIALFDVTTATQISQFDGGPGQLLALAFSPDGRYLASGSDGGDDQSLKVWDLTNGLPIDGVKGAMNYTRAVAFSADGRYLACGGVGVRVWDMQDKKVAYQFSGHKRRVNVVAFSADGSTLASGADDWMVGLWKLGAAK